MHNSSKQVGYCCSYLHFLIRVGGSVLESEEGKEFNYTHSMESVIDFISISDIIDMAKKPEFILTFSWMFCSNPAPKNKIRL